MKDNFKALTSEFGKELIKKTRDETICQIHEQVEKLTDKYYTDIYNKLSTFNQEQIEILKDIVIDTIDHTLMNFLWAMDQEERFDIIAYEKTPLCFHSLKDINAGLYDEYYYFVQEFSKFKMIELQEDVEKATTEKFPDERIMALFDANSPEEAKREFVKILNKKEDFSNLKERLHLLPNHLVELLIEMTLSRSSFHMKECEELKKLIS